MPADEVAGGEFLDLQAVDLGIELPVEGVQGFAFLEVGLTDAALDGAIAASGGLLAKKQIEELQMRQCLFIGAFEDSVQIVRRNRYSQDLEVVQAQVTKRSRVAVFHRGSSSVEGFQRRSPESSSRC